jgi:hypothetical protein
MRYRLPQDATCAHLRIQFFDQTFEVIAGDVGDRLGTKARGDVVVEPPAVIGHAGETPILSVFGPSPEPRSEGFEDRHGDWRGCQFLRLLSRHVGARGRLRSLKLWRHIDVDSLAAAHDLAAEVGVAVGVFESLDSPLRHGQWHPEV